MKIFPKQFLAIFVITILYTSRIWQVSWCQPSILEKAAVRFDLTIKKSESSKNDNIKIAGSGFILGNPGKYIITNWHVVDEIYDDPDSVLSINITHPTTKTLIIQPSQIKRSLFQDIAYIENPFPEKEGFELFLRPQQLKKYMLVWVLGHGRISIPRPGFIEGNMTPELIRIAVSRLESQGDWLYNYSSLTSARIVYGGPGDSGAPVVDDHGQLIGVVCAGYNDFTIIIPVSEFLHELKDAGLIEGKYMEPDKNQINKENNEINTNQQKNNGKAPGQAPDRKKHKESYDDFEEKLEKGEYEFKLKPN